MRRSLLFAALVLSAAPAVRAEDAPERLYQLRIYDTAPGKLPELLERFKAHNLPIFERNGIKLEGAWTPLEADDEHSFLAYLVSFPDRAAAERAWAAFGNDAEWKQTFAKEKADHGAVVTKAVTTYLTPTDYSPAPGAATSSGPARVYELRTYTASPGKLPNLDARFRDHTRALFAKHGMTNVLYTHPARGEKGEGSLLVYFLAFPDKTAADASWKAFRDDPEWQRVSAASQPDGVKLAAQVESLFLKPTGFSPMK